MKVGIVAVHGVIPQIRHGFQDEVGAALCGALNDRKNGQTWTSTVVLPRNRTDDASDVPTIARVYVAGDDPGAPAGDFFDVHEAYWSPIDKGKATLLGVLAWILASVFLPFNDFARYRAMKSKVAWDIAYISLAIVAGLGLMLFSALLAADTMRDVLEAMCANGGTPPAGMPGIRCLTGTAFPPFDWRLLFDFGNLFTMLAFLLSPLTFLKTFTPGVLVGMAMALAGAYLAWQCVRALAFVVFHVPAFLRRDPVQLRSRLIASAVLAILALLLLRAAWVTPLGNGLLLGRTGLALVVAVGAFEFGRTALASFLVNFFGDVQIYTTRDQNSEYFALRETILQTVVDAILAVVTTSPAGEPYDRVYVLAHSLGSTIAMDALLRLYDMQAASAGLQSSPLAVGDWKRLRGFITLGTSLEKTKYFFSVWNPTPSQQWEQWNAAIYGSVFTASFDTLAAPDASAGIYWHNSWYFSDFVADEISTYRSYLLPGEPLYENTLHMASLRAQGGPFVGRLVAANRGRFGPFPRHLETHTWYLQDPWFWHGTAPADIAAIDVIVSGLGASVLPKAVALPPRAVRIDPSQAGQFKSWEVTR